MGITAALQLCNAAASSSDVARVLATKTPVPQVGVALLTNATTGAYGVYELPTLACSKAV
jgi:hypothetical protein